MQKYELSFVAFEISYVWFQNELGYIFREISPKLIINIYIYSLTHSFFEVEYQSDALYWLYILVCYSEKIIFYSIHNSYI